MQDGSHKDEREQRQRLLEETRAAERAYRQAVAHSKAVLDRFSDLSLGHPDGDFSRRQAARAEASALEKYRNALKAFTEVVLNGRPPEPPRS